jgi:hypothetical protein
VRTAQLVVPKRLWWHVASNLSEADQAVFWQLSHRHLALLAADRAFRFTRLLPLLLLAVPLVLPPSTAEGIVIGAALAWAVLMHAVAAYRRTCMAQVQRLTDAAGEQVKEVGRTAVAIEKEYRFGDPIQIVQFPLPDP